MNMDMHDIHPCAYHICTVHMWYAHTSICMYEHVSVCIGFSYELYPVHMCMYVLKRPLSYSMIHSDVHIYRSAYLLVFECILCQHTCTYALMLMCIYVCIWLYSLFVYIQICTWCTVHIWMYLNVLWVHIPAHMHSCSCAYLFVSDCILCRYTFRYAHFVLCISECIWMYFAATFMHICTFHGVHMFLYVTVCFVRIPAHTSKWEGGFNVPYRPPTGTLVSQRSCRACCRCRNTDRRWSIVVFSQELHDAVNLEVVSCTSFTSLFLHHLVDHTVTFPTFIELILVVSCSLRSHCCECKCTCCRTLHQWTSQ